MLVTTKNFHGCLSHLSEFEEFVVDTETTGLNAFSRRESKSKQLSLDLLQFRNPRFDVDKMCGIAIGCQDGNFYFPLRHANQNLPIECLPAINRLLSNKQVTGFNYKFDLHFLQNEGFSNPKIVKDVIIAAHLLNENEPSLSLQRLGQKYLGDSWVKQQYQLGQTLKHFGLPKNDMWKLDPQFVEPYACEDVEITKQLSKVFEERLISENLYKLWIEYSSFILAIQKMEYNGIKLDTSLMKKYSDECAKKSAELENRIKKIAGFNVNLGSPIQLQKWLNIESTRAEVLEGLRESGKEGIQEILDYRAWCKAKANYYDKFELSKDKNNKIHPNLNITGTVTGRLSCSNPPMQAIPKETSIYKVKDIMIASPGNVLVEADYSQAEIRVATHFASERRMAEKLLRGADIHLETAEEINIPRDAAKRLNFSVIYGIGYRTLSERLEIPTKKAKSYLNKYHANYPGFKKLYNKARYVAELRGYIVLFSGRRRHFNSPMLAPSHKASSNLIQGSVAEMLRVAISKLHDQTSIRMLLTVHDSILFEIPEGSLKVLNKVKSIMEDQPWCSIPMVVDFKVGKSWGTAQPY